MTFNRPREEKCEEREDDPEFEDGGSPAGRKPEQLAEKVLEEDELIFLKDKRKLEVFLSRGGGLTEFRAFWALYAANWPETMKRPSRSSRSRYPR